MFLLRLVGNMDCFLSVWALPFLLFLSRAPLISNFWVSLCSYDLFLEPNKLKRNDLFLQSIFFFLLRTLPSILKLPSSRVWIIVFYQVFCPSNLAAIFTSLLQFDPSLIFLTLWTSSYYDIKHAVDLLISLLELPIWNKKAKYIDYRCYRDFFPYLV